MMVGHPTTGKEAGDGLFYTGPNLDIGVSTWITSYNTRYWLNESKAREHGDDVIMFMDDRGRNVYVPMSTSRYGEVY
jgi:hypothetical protein